MGASIIQFIAFLYYYCICALQPLVVEEQKTERRRCLTSAKVVAVSSVYFKFIRQPQDPLGYSLLMFDDEILPMVEEMESSIVENQIPLPGLLKGWKRETRERPSGARDKFYSHPSIKKTFRSVIEVLDYINTNNGLKNTEGFKDYTKSKKKLENAEELKDHISVKLSEASSSNAIKRKYNWWFQEESNIKIRISSPSDHENKTKEQIELEEFFANAYSNLMNLSPPTPETEKGLLTDAEYKNLLAFLENEDNEGDASCKSPSPEQVAAMMSELADAIGAPAIIDLPNPQQELPHFQPELPIARQAEEIVQLNPQQAANPNANSLQQELNGLTETELEVLQIFAGLNRSHENQLVH
ncbi:hypothetical protein ACH5RR_015888 [Cinchona calisaya]|uniref:MBD domain-containing protein n=1 Tax=Cinchona calisaya TaxID=153742 RepID=A0ABD2ZVB6_9GENT